MTRPIPQPSSTRRTVFMASLMWLVGCVEAKNVADRDPKMNSKQMTLWQTISALTNAMPMSVARVERALDIALQEQSRTANFVHYTGGALALADGLRVTKVDLQLSAAGEFNDASGLSLELADRCMTLAEVRAQYGTLTITQAPRGRSLQETTVHAVQQPWGALSFAFKEEAPDCLFRVSFRNKLR